MGEYVIRVRVVTDRDPRDVLNWEAVTGLAGAVFKTRPAGIPLVVVSATVELVPPAKSG